MQLCDDFRQNISRISNIPSKKSGMEVHFWAVNAYFKVHKTPQSVDNGGAVFVNHAGIRIEDHVTFQQISVIVNKVIQGW